MVIMERSVLYVCWRGGENEQKMGEKRGKSHVKSGERGERMCVVQCCNPSFYCPSFFLFFFPHADCTPSETCSDHGSCSPQGECRCTTPGFTGTHCDTCVQDYYGVNCDISKLHFFSLYPYTFSFYFLLP